MCLHFKLDLLHCIKHWRGCLYSKLKRFYFKVLYSNSKTETRKGGAVFLSRKTLKSSDKKTLKDAFSWEVPFNEIKWCLIADLKCESFPFYSTFQVPTQEESKRVSTQFWVRRRVLLLSIAVLWLGLTVHDGKSDSSRHLTHCVYLVVFSQLDNCC